MIHFLTELPGGTLEPNAIYLIDNGNGTAEMHVSDKAGRATAVATATKTQAQIDTQKGKANGIAGLGSDSRLAESTMPTTFQTAAQIQGTIQGAIDSLVDAAPEQLNTLKEFSAALGNDADFANTVTSQLAGKQATLANASSVAKIGEGTFDGKPLVVVSASQW